MSDADFEAPLVVLQKRIEEVESSADAGGREAEIAQLRDELDRLRRAVFGSLSPWQKTLVARHPQRPYTLDYVAALCTDWTELHGDRRFGDDPALVCGLARFHGIAVVVIGHQKGRDTRQKIYRNFGMPKPEGYRKALRIMKLAEQFKRPILSFVDTPGAYPGLDAEERGQAEAIAYNLLEMARLKTPVIVTITGEGGSGGALGIAVGDRVNMLEHSVYSVISPEGCASILWRDPGRAEQAAAAMKMTPNDLHALGLIDAVVPEPLGGGHANPVELTKAVDALLVAQLAELTQLPLDRLIEERYQKFRRMGQLGREFVQSP